MRATVTLITVALWSALSWAATDTDALAREMNILREILRTASHAKESRYRGRQPRPAPTPQVSRVTAHYLQGQGVLFRTSLRDQYVRSDRIREIYLANVPNFVSDVMSEVRASIGFIDSDELESLRELRDEQRDLREEQRDLRRKLRDQRRKMDRASARDRQTDDIESEIAELEAELAASEKQYDALVEEIELEHRRFSEERQGRSEQRKIDRGQAYAALESLLLQTLCDYGATLKSLPDREHVNLLIENARSENGDEVDRVYVFEKKDLLACQQQSIDLAQLRERTTVYDQ